jgi:Na+-translocating ferredoxin:NAD+ oxidoreductase RnfC subunit
MKKLHILQYDHPAHWEAVEIQPRRVVLPLKQNAGAANVPLVRPGDRVSAGQAVGQVPEKALGAPIHAPFAGRVVSVSDRIVLERTP